MGAIWDGLLEGLESVLRLYEGLFEPLAGAFAWGFAIIALTFTVRLLLVPLAIRQTKSMRAMQDLQPQIKRIQKKYKADRSMAKTDPERYKKLKEKQREETMALYQEHKVNPAGGCLPLLLQMPIFFALFRVLNQDGTNEATGEAIFRIPELVDAPFFGIDSLSLTPTDGVGIGAWVLVFLQVATTFYSQKQMQGRNASPEQAQQQKIMLYVMPAMLGFFCLNFPVGLVIYWVATNVWTMGQQWVIFRSIDHATDEDSSDRKRPVDGDRPRRTRDAGSDSKGGGARGRTSDTRPKNNGSSKKPSTRNGSKNGGPSGGKSSTNGKARSNGKNGSAPKNGPASKTNPSKTNPRKTDLSKNEGSGRGSSPKDRGTRR